MKKALKIIIPTLLAILGIFYVVAYILWKDQTTYITECIINFINKPLPIIGVSLGVVLFFVYKCFVSTKYGQKKINEYKQENDKLKGKIDELGSYIESIETTLGTDIKALNHYIDDTREYVIEGFELNKNIKVKEIAQKMRGVENEETIECDTEKEEI